MPHIRYLAIADAIGSMKPVETIIHISEALPKFDTLEAAEEFYHQQAEIFVDALFHSLPQGTRIRVVRKMFDMEISDHGFFRGL